jgi:acetyltransferase-like isoleucine patch superfamily enzyme
MGFGQLFFLLTKIANKISIYGQTSYFRSVATIQQNVKFLRSAQIYNIRGIREAIEVRSHTIVGGHLLTFKHGGQITIGEWCYVGENTRIWSASTVKIGNRVLISHDVNIHDTNSHSLDPVERHEHFVAISTVGHPEVVPNLQSAPVIIEDDVWIGCNSVILKGVTLGEASIIAAGSVVTKDVPKRTLVAGNPARIIREVK